MRTSIYMGQQGHNRGSTTLAPLLGMASSGPAVVENSFDAMLSKTLDGIITSWNEGASRVFGYAAEEAMGQPIAMLIPDDRLHEEEEILAKLRPGEHVSHFEPIRRGKDGRDRRTGLARKITRSNSKCAARQ